MKQLAFVAIVIAAAAPAAAQVPKPTAEHEQLQGLVGDWKADGTFLGGALRGEMKCERFAGGYHVQCRTRAELTRQGSVQPYEEIAVFGYAMEEKVYVWHGANSFGWMPLAGIRGRREPNGWTWTQETRAGGQDLAYRWVFVESKDGLAIKGTVAKAGGAPEVFGEVVLTR